MTTQPDPAYKARMEKESTSSPFLTACIALATCTLLAGAGFHFLGGGANSTTGATTTAQQGTDTIDQRIGVPASLIAPGKAQAALASAGYSEKEQAAILEGMKRRDFRLVALPVFDATGAGGSVIVSSGAMQRTVLLTAKPTVVILPIRIAGHVDILPVSDPGVTGIGTGVITLFGPETLPIMHQGDTLGLTVIAQ